MRTLVPLTCLVLLAGSPERARAEGYAIVVGVNACPDFRLPDGAKPRPLRGAEHDADGIAGALRTRFAFDPRHVYLLKGREATHDKLESAFQRVAKLARPDDTFVFHFSGHGTQLADRRPFDEPDRLDEALCTSDATSEGKHLVLDDELSLWLDRIPARRVTVILDCCHAGTGTKDPDDAFVPRYLPIKLPGPRSPPGKEPWRELQGSAKGFGRQMTAFFACRADQQAYERRVFDFNPPRRVGQFSHHLLEGMKDARADGDGDGIITNQEAFHYATQRLDATFNRTRPGLADRQIPVMETDAEEAPLFGLEAARATAEGLRRE